MNKKFHEAVTGGFTLRLSKAQLALLMDLYALGAGQPVDRRLAKGREVQALRLIEMGLIVYARPEVAGLTEDGIEVDKMGQASLYAFTKAGLLSFELVREAGMIPQGVLLQIEAAEARLEKAWGPVKPTTRRAP